MLCTLCEQLPGMVFDGPLLLAHQLTADISKMKLVQITLLGLILSTSSLMAETAIHFDYNQPVWSPYLGGNTQINFPMTSTDNAYKIEEQRATYLNLTFEHDIDFLPNIGLRTNIKEHKERANIDQLYIYDSIASFEGEAVDSKIDLTHRDHLIYYRLMSQELKLDLGMDIIRFDGRINLRSNSENKTIEFNAVMAGAYAQIHYDIPETSLYLKATATYAIDKSNTFNKARYMIGWQSKSGIAIEAGYQAYNAEWNDYKGTDGTLNFKGLYTGLRFNF